MYVDAKVDYRNRRLILIRGDGGFDEVELVDPYFYVICKPSQCKSLQALLPE